MLMFWGFVWVWRRHDVNRNFSKKVEKSLCCFFPPRSSQQRFWSHEGQTNKGIRVDSSSRPRFPISRFLVDISETKNHFGPPFGVWTLCIVVHHPHPPLSTTNNKQHRPRPPPSHQQHVCVIPKFCIFCSNTCQSKNLPFDLSIFPISTSIRFDDEEGWDRKYGEGFIRVCHIVIIIIIDFVDDWFNGICKRKSLPLPIRRRDGQDMCSRSRSTSRRWKKVTIGSRLASECTFCRIWIYIPWWIPILVNGK